MPLLEVPHANSRQNRAESHALLSGLRLSTGSLIGSGSAALRCARRPCRVVLRAAVCFGFEDDAS
jgi:hypothetical protein